MTPLSSEFEKFVKTVTKTIPELEHNQEFLRDLLSKVTFELFVLKKELKEKGIIDDTDKS